MRRRHLFLLLASWAIVLTVAIVLGTLTFGSGWILTVLTVPALIVLLVLGHRIGDRRAMIVVFLAGAGFYLQVLALSSLFSDMRLGNEKREGQLALLTIQMLGFAGRGDTETIDLSTKEGRDDLESRIQSLELLTLLNSNEAIDVRDALTPNFVDISLFALGTLIGFGSSAIGALPQASLPERMRSYIAPDSD